ncbi:MAG: hypothetical protein QNJ65_07970 [Xenococcaceae cyanobacterium MO_234.B1]|nr:hypothetical protein [Xenococcaceae cyanobacterium MO_234.B1]
MNNRLWSSLLASAATISPFPALADTSSTDYLFIVDQSWHDCKHLGAAYQEIKTFETANFYVNLCQKGAQYFYAGTAKNNSVESIFIPAYTTEQLNTYQADNGNISYIVEIKSTEAILKIQRNGNTLIVENSLSQNCPQVSYDPRVQISHELSYSNYQVQYVSDRLSVSSNQIYTPEINVLNQLGVADISEQKVFTSVSKQLSIFPNCF